jgi:hypothetical protein
MSRDMGWCCGSKTNRKEENWVGQLHQSLVIIMGKEIMGNLDSVGQFYPTLSINLLNKPSFSNTKL